MTVPASPEPVGTEPSGVVNVTGAGTPGALGTDEWRDDNEFSSDTRMSSPTAISEFRVGMAGGN